MSSAEWAGTYIYTGPAGRIVTLTITARPTGNPIWTRTDTAGTLSVSDGTTDMFSSSSLQGRYAYNSNYVTFTKNGNTISEQNGFTYTLTAPAPTRIGAICTR